jgi:hypothetical protein
MQPSSQPQGKVETVDVPASVSPAGHLEQIRKQRRVAEANFNDACTDVTRHRIMLQKSINTMEKAKRAFHSAEEEESAELMRQGLKR